MGRFSTPDPRPGVHERTGPLRTPFECYLTEINGIPLLTASEERALAARVLEGDVTARDRMTRANLRLVVSLARRYAGKGLPLEDLIADGNLGLMRAVEGFDPAAGTRFSTYAGYWVKQSIRAALTKSGHALRLPLYTRALLARWWRGEADLRAELGRAPVPGEVAARLGLTRREVTTAARAQKVLASGGGEGGDVDLGGVLADARNSAPGDELAAEEDTRAALGALDRLGTREAAVLRLRFGLGGGEPMTLEDVGVRFGVTRERTRQIEKSALAALRERLAA